MFSLNKSSATAVRQRDAAISTHKTKKNTNPQNFESLSALMPANQAGMTMGSIPVMLDLSPLMSGFLHHKEEKNLVDIYKDIYLYDAIAGTAVDLLSFLPFSEFTLRGLTDAQQRPFLESLERLNIYTLLPEVSVDYLVFGTFIGSLIFNQEKKIFIDIIPQDFKNCTITRLPFYGVDPIINVSLPKETVSVLTSSNARIQQVVKTYGRELIDKLVKGNLELDPLSTIYLPRRTMSNAEGISYYRRIIPLYFLEKNIFRGTLVESVKRQRAILHVTAGDLDWEPTSEDLAYISELFINADNDPLGAIIATRNGISTNDIRCLSGQTLINTEKGLIKIQDLVDHDLKTMVPGTEVNLSLKVKTHTGAYVPLKSWWYQGVKPTLNLVLEDGTEIKATSEHQFLTVDKLKLGFTKLGDLQTSQYVLRPLTITQRSYPEATDKQTLNPKLAYCLAILLNKGVVSDVCSESNSDSDSDITISLSLSSTVASQFYQFMNDLFGFKLGTEIKSFALNQDPELQVLSFSLVSSKSLVATLTDLGFDLKRRTEVPACIMQANQQNQLAFISGFFDSSFSLNKRRTDVGLAWEIRPELSQSILSLLSELGLRGQLKPKKSGLVLSLLSNPSLPFSLTAPASLTKQHGIPSQLVRDFLQSRLVNQDLVVNSSLTDLMFYDDQGEVVRVSLDWRLFDSSLLLYSDFDRGLLASALDLIKQVSKAAYNNLILLFHNRMEFCRIQSIDRHQVEPVYDLTVDPDYAPIFTANNICVHNSGGDFWQIEGVWSATFPAKLKALNISEEFVNGSASVATMEASMSGFVEQLRSYRTMITRKLFYNKIFPLISLTNELYIDDQARQRADELRAKAGRNSDLSTLLYQIQDTSSLLIPEIDWEKNLKPEGDSTYIDILKTMTDAGVPVPIRAMAAAGGIKLDKVLRQSEDDLALRKRLAEYQDRIKELLPKPEGDAGGGGYDGYSSAMSAMYHELKPEDQQKVLKDLQSLSKSALYQQHKRPAILDRKFNGEVTGTSKTGKPKSIYGQRTANERANLKIIKALHAMRKDNKTL